MSPAKDKTVILGAGVTGLAAGLSSGLTVYEASNYPGGICGSYYMMRSNNERLLTGNDNTYRFEYGGGHWIFGGDPSILHFIHTLSPTRSYTRKSSIFFADKRLYVPYPLQYNLSYLDKTTSLKALKEMSCNPRLSVSTMADWHGQCFGKTLTELFFGPFHELYTAGLWNTIAPQDAYKSPLDLKLVIAGTFDKTPAVGYNKSFIYPINGLNSLATAMKHRAHIEFESRVERIDLANKKIYFTQSKSIAYDTIISTLPLNKMLNITGLDVGEESDPYTSVLVLNIGAKPDSACPNDHWIYIPHSRSGFHRVGFYSNVDKSFLPSCDESLVSIYVEKAYAGGKQPSAEAIQQFISDAIEELGSWGWIKEVQVIDATWIEVAYTWSFPDSRWKDTAIKQLEKYSVFQIGRYGRWIFQGIADSIKDGLLFGASLKPF
jgi:protoporphyrinogen oxidase